MVNQDKILHIAQASARSNFPFFISGDVSFTAAKKLGSNSLFLYFTDDEEEITQEDKDYYESEFAKEWDILLADCE